MKFKGATLDFLLCNKYNYYCTYQNMLMLADSQLASLASLCRRVLYHDKNGGTMFQDFFVPHHLYGSLTLAGFSGTIIIVFIVYRD